jgi:hypothetical protein
MSDKVDRTTIRTTTTDGTTFTRGAVPTPPRIITTTTTPDKKAGAVPTRPRIVPANRTKPKP